MRILALSLAATLLAAPALADGLGEMTEAERAAFHAEVRAYLIANPEVIVEAMEVLQAREAASAVERDAQMLAANAAALFSDPESWVGGNPDGDITLVEFIDYRCGYCRKAQVEVDELVRSDGNIRVIVKEFPILGEQSLASSQFAIAVRQLHGDAAYKAAHDALITLRGDATPDTLSRLAQELGHDPQAVLARMAAPEVRAVIDANHALGSAMEVNGTPMFVVQNEMVRGYLPLEDMRAVVAAQRKG